MQIYRFAIRRMDKREILNDTDSKEFIRTIPLIPLHPRTLISSLGHFLFFNPKNLVTSILFSLKMSRSGGLSYTKAAQYFIGAVQLAGHCRKVNVDCLHVHFANSGACIGAITSKLLNLRWGISLHGLSDFGGRSLYLLPMLIDSASFVRCISKFGRSQAMLYSSPKNWDKIFVSYSGIELKSRSQKYGAHDNITTMITIGRLAPEKAHLLLLSAVSRIVAQGVILKLIIIGDGPMRKSIEQKISELHLDKICFLMGSVAESEVPEHLSRSDIFVLSSLMEGIPQVLLEAMMAQIPVVAPRLAGIPELVTDGVDGLLFTPGDEDSLVESLLTLVKNRELQTQLSNAARTMVEKKFLIEDTIRPLCDILL